MAQKARVQLKEGGVRQFKPKLWLGIGVVALAGSAATHAVEFDQSSPSQGPAGKGGTITLAEARGAGGEGGEAGAQRPRTTKSKDQTRKPVSGAKPKRGAGGEGGEGGERGTRQLNQRRGQGGEGGERGARQLSQRRGQGGEGGEAGVNTRYIFGFTEGADTERKGELEIESDNTGRFQKREGSYTALQNKLELEYGVTNDLMVAYSMFLQSHRIKGVPDLEDTRQTRFDGVAGEVKYRFLDRRTAPFGFAISAEPELRLYSETSGGRENAYVVELKAYVDKELVPDKLFVAGNLLYEPEAVRVRELNPEFGTVVKWEHESTFGASGAIAAAIASYTFLGAEVRHLRKYEGLGLDRLVGHATFVGPTLSVRLSPKALLQAAYSIQVSGRAVDDPDHRLDLINFEKHNARLRFVYEF